MRLFTLVMSTVISYDHCFCVRDRSEFVPRDGVGNSVFVQKKGWELKNFPDKKIDLTRETLDIGWDRRRGDTCGFIPCSVSLTGFILQ